MNTRDNNLHFDYYVHTIIQNGISDLAIILFVCYDVCIYTCLQALPKLVIEAANIKFEFAFLFNITNFEDDDDVCVQCTMYV